MVLSCTLAVADASVPYRLTLHRVRSEKVSVDVALDAVVLRRAADIADFVRGQLPKAFRKATVDCGHDLLVTDVGETHRLHAVVGGARPKPLDGARSRTRRRV